MKTRHQTSLEASCGPVKLIPIKSLDRWQLTIISREPPPQPLTDDIRCNGVQHPIIVTDGNIILDGTKRVSAAISLGHTSIPARHYIRDRR